ncbi:hypothetical protein GCM10009541_00210 [Micromonospora gifhornensis]|uniref:Uncharacterized protein n=1 Tax=Micromonospora gifhornensis TaxID=84594 RepID=A0ABQ4IJI3_9ACTN|nr:hypothetical protein Vgi01_47410 [Micromonospora gifhornensis]
MLHLRAKDPFEGGVDLGERPTDLVRDAGGFAGEVVIEANQDFQLCEGFVPDVDAPQRVGQGRAASAMT